MTWDVRERKRRMKKNPKVFGLGNQRDGVSKKGDGKATGRIG